MLSSSANQPIFPLTLSEFRNLSYSQKHTGPHKLPKEALQSSSEKCIIANYGELSSETVDEMIAYMDIREDDVYYELGCGKGKCCFQMFFCSMVGKVIGVEVDARRINIAINSLKEFKRNRRSELRSYFREDRHIDFQLENIMHVDFSDVTILYTCSWNKEWQVGPLNTYTEDVLNRAENLRYIFALHHMKGVIGMHVVKIVRVKSDVYWGRDAQFLYLHEKRDQHPILEYMESYRATESELLLPSAAENNSLPLTQSVSSLKKDIDDISLLKQKFDNVYMCMTETDCTLVRNEMDRKSTRINAQYVSIMKHLSHDQSLLNGQDFRKQLHTIKEKLLELDIFNASMMKNITMVNKTLDENALRATYEDSEEDNDNNSSELPPSEDDATTAEVALPESDPQTNNSSPTQSLPNRLSGKLRRNIIESDEESEDESTLVHKRLYDEMQPQMQDKEDIPSQFTESSPSNNSPRNSADSSHVRIAGAGHSSHITQESAPLPEHNQHSTTNHAPSDQDEHFDLDIMNDPDAFKFDGEDDIEIPNLSDDKEDNEMATSPSNDEENPFYLGNQEQSPQVSEKREPSTPAPPHLLPTQNNNRLPPHLRLFREKKAQEAKRVLQQQQKENLSAASNQMETSSPVGSTPEASSPMKSTRTPVVSRKNDDSVFKRPKFVPLKKRKSTSPVEPSSLKRRKIESVSTDDDSLPWMQKKHNPSISSEVISLPKPQWRQDDSSPESPASQDDSTNIALLKKQLVDLQNSLSEEKQRSENLSKRHIQTEHTLEAKQSELAVTHEELIQVKQHLDLSRGEQQQLQQKLESLSGELKQAQGELTSTKTRFESQLRATRSELRSLTTQYNKEKEQNKVHLAAAQDRSVSLEKELIACREKLTSSDSNLKEMQEKLLAANGELDELRKQQSQNNTQRLLSLLQEEQAKNLHLNQDLEKFTANQNRLLQKERTEIRRLQNQLNARQSHNGPHARLPQSQKQGVSQQLVQKDKAYKDEREKRVKAQTELLAVKRQLAETTKKLKQLETSHSSAGSMHSNTSTGKSSGSGISNGDMSLDLPQIEQRIREQVQQQLAQQLENERQHIINTFAKDQARLEANLRKQYTEERQKFESRMQEKHLSERHAMERQIKEQHEEEKREMNIEMWRLRAQLGLSKESSPVENKHPQQQQQSMATGGAHSSQYQHQQQQQLPQIQRITQQQKRSQHQPLVHYQQQQHPSAYQVSQHHPQQQRQFQIPQHMMMQHSHVNVYHSAGNSTNSPMTPNGTPNSSGGHC